MVVENIGGHDRSYVKPETHIEVPDVAPVRDHLIRVDSGATAANINTGTVGLLSSFAFQQCPELLVVSD